MNYDYGNAFGNYHINGPQNNGFLTSLVEEEKNAQVSNGWNCQPDQAQFIQDESLYNLLQEDYQQGQYACWDGNFIPEYNYQQYTNQYPNDYYANYNSTYAPNDYNYPSYSNHNFNQSNDSQFFEYSTSQQCHPQCYPQSDPNRNSFMNQMENPYNVYYMDNNNYQNYQQMDMASSRIFEQRKMPTSHQEYSCETCQKTFKHPYLLERHMKTRDHQNIKDFKCELCKKAFTQVGHLNRHYKIVHQKLPCDKEMSFRHHGMPQLTTILQRSQKKNTLTDVIKGLIELFECPNCNEIFQKYVDFRNHLTTAHPELKKFPCPHRGCSLLFDNLEETTLHFKEEHPNSEVEKNCGPLRCNICRQDFTRSDSLKRHMRKHEEKRLACPFKEFTKCMRTFYRLDDLKQHLDDHKDPKFKSATLACDVCGKLYKSLKELEKHKTTHPNKFKAHCPKCYKGFKNSHGLRVHSCPVTNERKKKNSVRMKRLHQKRRKEAKESS